MRHPAMVLALVVPAVLLMVSPHRCAAGDPGGSNSTIPQTIRLVGHDGNGIPDPTGLFTVTVRNLANDPVEGANVIVDFNDCPDAQLATVQQPGVTIVCTVGASAFTDSHGTVAISLIGRARGGPPVNGHARIYADGVLLGFCKVSIFDLDGGDGVHGSDLSAWTADFVSGGNPYRSDYDGNGLVGGGDLAQWAGVFIRGKSNVGATSLGPVCP